MGRGLAAAEWRYKLIRKIKISTAGISSVSGVRTASKKKLTRRDRFLAEIETATPWAALVAGLPPYYPDNTSRDVYADRGSPSIERERELKQARWRVHVAAQTLDGRRQAGLQQR